MKKRHIIVLLVFGILANVFLNANLIKSNDIGPGSTSLQLQSDESIMVGGRIGIDDYLEGMILDNDENVIIYGSVAGNIGFFRHDPELELPLNSSDNAIWGEGTPRVLKIDSIGNIYIAGYRYPDVYFIKYNNNLELQWNKTWRDAGLCYDMIIDSNDNVFLARTENEFDLLLIKYDQNGSELWSFNFTNDLFPLYMEDYEILAKDSNENIFIVYDEMALIEGHIYGPILRILKISNSGSVLLNFTHIPSNYEYNVLRLRKIIIDDFDNLYILGRKFYTSDRDYQILKYNNLGVSQWNRSYNFFGADNYYYVTMELDKEGNLYLLEAKEYVALAKISPSSGYILWQTPHQNMDTWGSSIAFDSQNNIYLVGGVRVSDFNRDILLIKYDTNGNFIGKKTWDYHGNETGSSIVINSNDEIFVAGRTNSFFSSDYDLFLLKADPIDFSPINLLLIIGISLGTAALISIGIILFLRKRRKSL